MKKVYIVCSICAILLVTSLFVFNNGEDFICGIVAGISLWLGITYPIGNLAARRMSESIEKLKADMAEDIGKLYEQASSENYE